MCAWRVTQTLMIATTLVGAGGCSRSNNLFLGRVQATVGTHTVVVTDCYRTSVPPPQTIAGAGGQAAYQFKPCRDAEVLIQGDQLTVNGKSYGPLRPHDGVLVDHGVVSVRREYLSVAQHHE